MRSIPSDDVGSVVFLLATTARSGGFFLSLHGSVVFLLTTVAGSGSGQIWRWSCTRRSSRRTSSTFFFFLSLPLSLSSVPPPDLAPSLLPSPSLSHPPLPPRLLHLLLPFSLRLHYLTLPNYVSP